MFETINNNIGQLFQNKQFAFIIKSLLIYYIIFVSFNLNSELVVLFDNSVIKILIIMMIFYTSTYDIQIAILITMSMIFSLNTLNKNKLNDLLNITEEVDYLDMLSDESENDEKNATK